MSQNIKGCEFKLNPVEKTLNLTDPKKVTGYQTSYIQVIATWIHTKNKTLNIFVTKFESKSTWNQK